MHAAGALYKLQKYNVPINNVQLGLGLGLSGKERDNVGLSANDSANTRININSRL